MYLDKYNLCKMEVLTAVTMKNTVFWDITRVAVVRTNDLEELHHQGDKNRGTRVMESAMF
jgi:hypothetical protein